MQTYISSVGWNSLRLLIGSLLFQLWSFTFLPWRHCYSRASCCLTSICVGYIRNWFILWLCLDSFLTGAHTSGKSLLHQKEASFFLRVITLKPGTSQINQYSQTKPISSCQSGFKWWMMLLSFLGPGMRPYPWVSTNSLLSCLFRGKFGGFQIFLHFVNPLIIYMGFWRLERKHQVVCWQVPL